MKNKELMLGNFVYDDPVKGFPMYVTGIFDDVVYLDFDGNEGDVWEVNENDLAPIVVTEELLNKMNFSENQDAGMTIFEYSLNNSKFMITINNLSNHKDKDWYAHIDNEAFETIGGFDFQYVHELQNGIMTITGEEFPIDKNIFWKNE